MRQLTVQALLLTGIALLYVSPDTASSSETFSRNWVRTGERICKAEPDSWAQIEENKHVRCSDFSLFIALSSIGKIKEASKLTVTSSELDRIIKENLEREPAKSD